MACKHHQSTSNIYLFDLFAFLCDRSASSTLLHNCGMCVVNPLHLIQIVFPHHDKFVAPTSLFPRAGLRSFHNVMRKETFLCLKGSAVPHGGEKSFQLSEVSTHDIQRLPIYLILPQTNELPCGVGNTKAFQR